MIKQILLLTLILIIAGCGESEFAIAEKTITASDLEKHIKVLASDEFAGRKPFTAGEEKTVEYIKNQFEKIGLQPVYNGSYFQEIPVMEVKLNPSEKINFNTQSGNYDLKHLDDMVLSTNQLVEKITVNNSEIIFVGYGIVAPEYNWNDYAGIDVKGKTVMMLVNDPGLATENPELFKGTTMTYYGRWTYKYEEAARQGAEGVILIHQDRPAGYPWEVVRNGFGVKLYLKSSDNYMNRCKFESWIRLDRAKELFEKSGKSFEELIAAAAVRGFKPVPLNSKISLNMDNRVREKTTKNVIGLYPGTDKKDECIIFTGHWDHLGIGRVINNDSIYNGAADNAAAVAWMLEIAQAFTSSGIKTSRSILFISPTGEETGLLGSSYYAANPFFPLNKTIAVFNTDVLPFLGSMKDLTITGFGQSTLDDYVGEIAKEYGRYIMPDPDSHNGMYFRSDHFSFAKLGVPGFFAKGCSEHLTKGKEWARAKATEYWAKTYHQPSDEYNSETADLSGLVDDTKLFFRTAYKLSNDSYYPKWKDGSEFKEIREKSLKNK